MEIITTQKFIKTAPRKLRLVAEMIRKMQPAQALTVLGFTPKYAARDISAAIKTALGNAKVKGLSAEGLAFKVIEVNEGPKLKRIKPKARGRVNPYKKQMSHIKIVLTTVEAK